MYEGLKSSTLMQPIKAIVRSISEPKLERPEMHEALRRTGRHN